jgi:hypothetical protein
MKIISIVVVFLTIAMLVFLSIFQSTPSQKFKIHQEIKYLSYIPPLDMTGIVEPLYQVSLEKVDFFKETDIESDQFAQLEQLNPIIDKVIYIPDGFHEYTSLDSNNKTSKIG